MSRLKNMPGAGWFVAGVAVAVLLIPGTVGAVAALKYTGIEGTSTNKADVAPAGQLLTTAAAPSSYFLPDVPFSYNGYGTVYAPPSGDAAILTGLHVDVYPGAGPNPSPSSVDFYLGDVSFYGCNGNFETVDRAGATTNATTVLPFDPGVVIPAGFELCGDNAYASSEVFAYGYTVPAADAPSEPLAKKAMVQAPRV